MLMAHSSGCYCRVAPTAVQCNSPASGYLCFSSSVMGLRILKCCGQPSATWFNQVVGNTLRMQTTVVLLLSQQSVIVPLHEGVECTACSFLLSSFELQKL